MLENSTLMNSVREVTTSTDPIPLYSYTCRVRLPDGTELAPLRMVSWDIARDYLKSYADDTYITLVFGIGTYHKYIFGNKEDLTIIVVREVVGEHIEAYNEPINIREFKAVLCETKDASASGSAIMDNVEVADTANISLVRFQLIDRVTEWVRSVSVGGSFRQTSPGEVLESIITTKLGDIPREILEDQGSINIVAPDNTEKRAHVVVPHATPLNELADWLQEKCGGIYSTGLGFYLQEGSWYVWPALNTHRFESEPQGLTIVNVPEDKMPSIERTWLQKQNQLTILSTGKTDITDNSDKLKLDQGIGIRFNDAKSLFSDFVTTVDNVTKAARGRNVTELTIEEAVDGIKHVARGIKRVSSNLFSELSVTASRQGTVVTATWENSDTNILYPGMPVRFLYEVENQIMIKHGVLIGAQHFISMEGKGGSSTRFKSNSALMLFLGKEDG